MLNVDPSDAVPIWKQIEDEIRRLVAMGSLLPNGPVPSVRDLAKELRVNPATVSKAYQRLTLDGVLVVRRGEGTFVSESVPVPNRTERREALQNAADKFVGVALTLGASQMEIEAEVARAIDRAEKESRKKS
jgi:GntR family transcriptional regulator